MSSSRNTACIVFIEPNPLLSKSPLYLANISWSFFHQPMRACEIVWSFYKDRIRSLYALCCISHQLPETSPYHRSCGIMPSFCGCFSSSGNACKFSFFPYLTTSDHVFTNAAVIIRGKKSLQHQRVVKIKHLARFHFFPPFLVCISVYDHLSWVSHTPL